jgi:hypothetical protein
MRANMTNDNSVEELANGVRLSEFAHHTPEFSDDALALTFASQYCEDLRYIAMSGQWLRWDLSRWTPEKTLLSYDLA